ncbi:ABC transporter ATP-binding protein [Herbaspirillum sp. RTI4]|uniref:ABC transporter ATP-binding protein n=1 Tax=Herbaspirillum sp. RTI4 TaxID=3048640 RepID=UPI002AB3C175|nr:ABC transporter ATP-binding protein [Herbaspirillum sp. RTI4]MDY7579426.1 ABC transporter ATP-binding protein [Herbaspirillum sp. RTI4]MEA9980340.1 ABC transporter ATP-binding protein [Herbaspirillum sp. RTI4]
MSAPLLSVRNLSVEFHGNRTASALNQVNLDVPSGHVLALLGESGSGKSVTLRTLLRLHAERSTHISGSIVVDGVDVLQMRGKELEHYRGGIVSMVFQESGLAFDPVYTIGQQISEAIRAHEKISRKDARERALQMLEKVQIPQPQQRYEAYPHELSGGMRQRAMIALALACSPKLLLADEPTTALDATVQIQILLLLRALQRETGMSVIFVTHDIGAAVEMADSIAVMYAGRIVEQAAVADIVQRPRHPYTAGLLQSTVGEADRGHTLTTIPGSPPDLAALPAGCAFAPRCSYAEDICRQEQPVLAQHGASKTACWFPIAWSASFSEKAVAA